MGLRDFIKTTSLFMLLFTIASCCNNDGECTSEEYAILVDVVDFSGISLLENDDFKALFLNSNELNDYLILRERVGNNIYLFLRPDVLTYSFYLEYPNVKHLNLERTTKMVECECEDDIEVIDSFRLFVDDELVFDSCCDFGPIKLQL